MSLEPRSCFAYVCHESYHVLHCVNEDKTAITAGVLSWASCLLMRKAVLFTILVILSFVHDAARMLRPFLICMMIHMRIAWIFFTDMNRRFMDRGAALPLRLEAYPLSIFLCI